MAYTQIQEVKELNRISIDFDVFFYYSIVLIYGALLISE